MQRAAALALLLGLLCSCGVVRVVKDPEAAPTGPLGTFKFEGGNPGDSPAGWRTTSFLEGETVEPPRHKFELTESQKRSGKMSAQLGPAGDKKLKDGAAEARLCGQSPNPDGPVRVSAFVRGDPGGMIQMYAYAGANLGSSVSQMSRRGGEWSRYQLVAVPPAGTSQAARPSQQICVTVVVEGSNRAWIDDLTFSKVDLAGLPPESVRPVALDNLDMERFDRAGRLNIWTHAPGLESGELQQGFALSADTKIKRSGRASLRLSNEETLQEPPGDSAEYCLDAGPVTGKMLRLAGWFRLDVAEGAFAGAGFDADAGPYSRQERVADLPDKERLRRGDTTYGSTGVQEAPDWVRLEQILGVPKTATNVCISVQLDQKGSVWVDDFVVETIAL